VGTFGTGPFDSDDARDLVDQLADQPGQRREVLEHLFGRVRDRPGLLDWEFSAGEVVAAAAIVAAGLPGGEDVQQQLVDLAYDLDAILIPAPDGELIDAARQALLLVAGRDGAWHNGWINPEEATQARQTSNHLTAIFLREQHSQDQQLPLEF
jgi:alpha-glucosidase